MKSEACGVARLTNKRVLVDDKQLLTGFAGSGQPCWFREDSRNQFAFGLGLAGIDS